MNRNVIYFNTNFFSFSWPVTVVHKVVAFIIGNSSVDIHRKLTNFYDLSIGSKLYINGDVIYLGDKLFNNIVKQN